MHRFLGFLELAGVAIAYSTLGWLGMSLTSNPRIASAVWPASGLAIACLLLRGDRLWVGIFVGSLFLEFETIRSIATHAPIGNIIVATVLIAAASSAQAFLGSYLVRKYIGVPMLFRRAANVLLFVSFEMLVCVLAATVGMLALGSFGISPWESFQENWVTWWLGDFVGVLTVGSLILLWASTHTRSSVTWKSVGEVCFHTILLLITAQLIFGVPMVGWGPHFERGYIFLPLLIWVLFRWGQAEAMTAVFVASSLAIWATVLGLGPFAGETLFESLLSVQTFVGVLTIMGLALGAALGDRRNADEEKSRLLQTEKRLRIQLSRSNDQLSRFAHVASHDLTEPLRMVSLYLSLLERNCHERLQEESRQYIHYAVDGANRMKRLLESLVTYSQASSRQMILTRVWFEQIVSDVRNNLRFFIEEKGALITCDALPSVNVDPALMGQLLQNVVGNSIKYQKPGIAPAIHISAERGHGEWIIQVRDNGIGIDMKHSERIFQVFQRLHPVDEFPGAGLGLSICKTIIEKHQGRIWVTSERGKGSTFCFAIPDYVEALRSVLVLQEQNGTNALSEDQAVHGVEVGTNLRTQSNVY